MLMVNPHFIIDQEWLKCGLGDMIRFNNNFISTTKLKLFLTLHTLPINELVLLDS